jgi:hypothetical protein
VVGKVFKKGILLFMNLPTGVTEEECVPVLEKSFRNAI